jgi:tRNA-splicing ligase RtcB
MANYEVFTQNNAVPVKAWTQGVPFEDAARQQVMNVASLPFVHKWVAIMPDVHCGKGATIGSVVPTHAAIIPAAVGVDIGCGMMAAKTSLKANDLPDSLGHVRAAIEKAVPHGRSNNGGRNDRGAWGKIPNRVAAAWVTLEDEFAVISDKHSKVARANHINHLGTLGTGNHFIEVCLDENDDVWFMLHSGSRGIGNRIGSYFIELAKKDMRTWHINLPDKDLAYLPEGTDHFNDYVQAVDWAQRFAMLNRQVMMANVVEAVSNVLPIAFEAHVEAVNCHHNYVEREHHYNKNVWVTRKGAVRAREGELGIIPGSMGARSYIVRGKGNAESFCSCSHGAGRVMSRTEARRRFSIDDHVAATKGVECRKDKDVIDETPAAYKDIDAVMEAQRDLVDVVHTLRQVVCVKG